MNPMKKLTKRGWIAIALAGCLLLAGAVCAGVWGRETYWRVQDALSDRSVAPSFHADWTPEEQKALLHLRRLVQWDYFEKQRKDDEKMDAMLAEAGLVDNPVDDKAVKAMGWAMMRHFSLGIVDKTIAGGPSAIQAESFSIATPGEGEIQLVMSPLKLAAAVGAWDALKVLVLRGADPNEACIMRHKSDYFEEMVTQGVPLGDVLSGATGTGDYADHSWQDRLELCQWLIERGAHFRNKEVHWEGILYVAAGVLGKKNGERHPEVLEWAMANGLEFDQSYAALLFDLDGTLPLIKRLVEEKKLDLFATGESDCLRMALLSSFASDDEEKVSYLLDCGVSPNGCPPVRQEGESDEDWQERRENWAPPMRWLLARLCYSGWKQMDDPDAKADREKSLRLLKLLISRGADVPDTEDLPTTDKEMQELIKAAIREAK